MQSKDNTIKKCGILLALSSLPSKHGIGSLGKEAYDFVDLLAQTGQSYWQILPLCPIGKGNSPYSSVASFAGEMLYIDLETLREKEYIDNIPPCKFSKNTDFEKSKEFKKPIILDAVLGFDTETREFKSFCKKNEFWLDDYAIFSAIKDVMGGLPYTQWEDGLKYRLPEHLQKFKAKYPQKIEYYKIIQYIFYSQYFKLKKYANNKGIKIIGDIPFYISGDSADVWANPNCFKLSRDLKPTLIAGVPPDIFSQNGQLWENPIYDWEYMKTDEYAWWTNRLKHAAEMYDVIRIDHFRAFNDYYTIPYGSKDAKNGCWVKGVGIEFFDTVMKKIPKCEIIAEDLGGESEDVQKLIKDTGFPNMKILQFAFDSDLEDPFLPQNFGSNCVCYTGTHDNDTTLGWYEKATVKEKIMFNQLIDADQTNSPVLSLIKAAMESKADTVIIPFQDYLELNSHSRLNLPGIAFGNWEWRFEKQDITENLKIKISRLSSYR